MIFKIFELKQLIRIIKYLNFNTIYEYMENYLPTFIFKTKLVHCIKLVHIKTKN